MTSDGGMGRGTGESAKSDFVHLFYFNTFCFTCQPSVSGDYLNVYQRIKDQEAPVLLWQLGEFVDPDKPEWIKGQFEINTLNDDTIKEYRQKNLTIEPVS